MSRPSFTDSHAHLDRDVYDTDRPEALRRAREAGVNRIVNVALGPEPDTLARAATLASSMPGVVLAAGVHPHDVVRMGEGTLDLLRRFCRDHHAVALGEIGLDFHYDHSPRDLQRRRFRELLELALEIDLPVVIHSREASEETLRILRETGALAKVGGVLHCFGGSAAEAEAYLELGAYIGFAGIVTFKKATNVREAARAVPWDRILIETDAPFLSPEPFRGNRNEPAYVVRVAEELARIKGESIEEAARITTENAASLFRLPAA